MNKPYEYSDDNIELDDVTLEDDSETVEIATARGEIPDAFAAEEAQPTREVEGVRAETVAAWDRLLSQGGRPSVRRVYAVVGGAYNALAEECKLLRAADAPGNDDDFEQTNDVAEEPETPEAPALTLQDAEATLQNAEEALEATQEKQATLEAEVEASEQALGKAVDLVRELEQKMLEGELVQDQLIAARKERVDAHLRIGDMQSLAEQHTPTVEEAEAALEAARYDVTLARYNELATQRPPLREAVENALEVLASAIQELEAHSTKQRDLAKTLGWDGVPGESTQAHEAPLAWWLYAKLNKLVVPPQQRHNFPLRIDTLADVDLASQPVTHEQAAALSDPERRQFIRLGNRREPGWVDLSPWGILALLRSGVSIKLNAAQIRHLRSRGISLTPHDY